MAALAWVEKRSQSFRIVLSSNMGVEKKKIIEFSVGICAYNEAANIGKLIKAIINQRLDNSLSLKEIIVVASGCTDGTEKEVAHWQKKDHRIRLIVEKQRKGKASAVNKFLKAARCDYLILASADLIPERDCFQELISGLSSPEVGMTAAHVIPLNKDDTLIGFAVNLQWRLHHKINLQFPEHPKAGELIAFKKIFKKIPASSAVDEASIEPLIYFQGYKVRYCPEAIVYNKGPRTVHDFLRQRRRIYAGHTDLSRNYGYKVITYSNFRVLGTLLANMEWNRRFFTFVPIIIILEAVGRIIGYLDCILKRRSHTVWKIARSTKNLNETQ